MFLGRSWSRSSECWGVELSQDLILYSGSVHLVRSNSGVYRLTRKLPWTHHKFIVNWIFIESKGKIDILKAFIAIMFSGNEMNRICC